MSDFVSKVSQDVLQGRGPGQTTSGTTYPTQRREPRDGSAGFLAEYDVQARYKMFDLSRESAVTELEEIMTDIAYGKRVLRDERWSHDKEGLTVVTLSWLDLSAKKKKKKFGPEFYRDGENPEDEDVSGTPDVANVTLPGES